MKRWIATAAVISTIPLFGPGSASAFTEVGSSCTANTPLIANDLTVFQLESNESHPLPLAVTSPGVVTGWKVNATKVAGPLDSQKLVVLRALGGPGEFLVRGESSLERIFGGPNVFETRIPVGPGDRFGVYAPGGLFICQSSSSADKIGSYDGSASVGSTVLSGGTLDNYQLPLTAIVEPDADGDGYGDETQDDCPSDPQTQGACPSAPPPFALDSFALVRNARSVLVLASASAAASVSVSATARTPKAAKSAARRSALLRLRGPSRQVSAGEIARLTLRLTKALRASLRALSRKRSLPLRIVVTGRDEAGQTINDRLTVKLKGQARPGSPGLR